MSNIYFSGSGNLFFSGSGFVTILPTQLESPTITSILCKYYIFEDTSYISIIYNVNNIGISDITVRASFDSNFTSSTTSIKNGGATGQEILLFNNFGSQAPGQTTVYLRLERAGYNNSQNAVYTANLTLCGAV